MYNIIRSFLFTLDAERAHNLALGLLRWPLVRFFNRLIFKRDRSEQGVELFGLNFANVVGLAAGLDKNATCYQELHDLGFGFVEVGTVTPKAQAGNEKPRLFRLKQDEAIINRMGFNNHGVDAMVQQLKSKPKDLIVGGNIGKNKTTPNENAIDDYEICFKELHPYVDYFVVNVSSPNTPDLRSLQEKEPLKQLLAHLILINQGMDVQRPILLKIAPDLSNEQLDDIIEIVTELKLDGIIATNTTINREGLHSSQKLIDQAGGLSGKPLNQRSTEVIAYISKESNGQIPIIGVGGIMSAQDAIDKINAGAKLVQVYTGFIYNGPDLISDIARAYTSLKS